MKDSCETICLKSRPALDLCVSWSQGHLRSSPRAHKRASHGVLEEHRQDRLWGQVHSGFLPGPHLQTQPVSLGSEVLNTWL